MPARQAGKRGKHRLCDPLPPRRRVSKSAIVDDDGGGGAALALPDGSYWQFRAGTRQR